jgi:AcrR family transcriptional regulator
MGAEDRRRQEKEVKKKDIVDAAERVFFSKGYEYTYMDEVAREAEYSKRTVYIYFNSKEQIYFEIMIRGYNLLIEMMEKTLRDKAPQNGVEELRLIFFTFFRFSVEHNNYFKAIMEYETKVPDEGSGIEDESKYECYRLGELMFGNLVHALQRGVTEGSLRSGIEIEKTALILWACTVGIFVTGEKKSQYLVDFHKTKPDAFVSDAFELIIHSICAEGSPTV